MLKGYFSTSFLVSDALCTNHLIHLRSVPSTHVTSSHFLLFRSIITEIEQKYKINGNFSAAGEDWRLQFFASSRSTTSNHLHDFLTYDNEDMDIEFWLYPMTRWCICHLWVGGNDNKKDVDDKKDHEPCLPGARCSSPCKAHHPEMNALMNSATDFLSRLSNVKMRSHSSRHTVIHYISDYDIHFTNLVTVLIHIPIPRQFSAIS